MQIKTKVDDDGRVSVEVIDPSDGAVTHAAAPATGEQIVVTATTAHSPADIEFGGCEAIPEQSETEDSGESEGVQQPSPSAEGAEESTDDSGTPAEAREEKAT